MPIIHPYSIQFKYRKYDDILEMHAGKGWGLYLENSIYLFTRAFNQVRNEISKNFVMNIALSDSIEELPNDIQYYGFGTGDPNLYQYLIPSPFFINWKGCKIKDYDIACSEIYEAGKKAPIYKQCFWSGNIQTHESRIILYESFKNNDNFSLHSMYWTNSGFGKLATPSFYIPMVEQTKYKYLIDIRGNGWSGRLPFLMFANRPLFYAERDPISFFEQDLQPYIHYVPINKDLSNLEQQYLWAESNQEEVNKIAKNALDYAINYLTQDKIIEYYSKKILECANNTLN